MLSHDPNSTIVALFSATVLFLEYAVLIEIQASAREDNIQTYMNNVEFGVGKKELLVVPRFIYQSQNEVVVTISDI